MGNKWNGVVQRGLKSWFETKNCVKLPFFSLIISPKRKKQKKYYKKCILY